jgi:hypothetical protein
MATDFIAPDTYQGKHSTFRPAAGIRPTAWKAAELAELAPSGVIWESFGHVNGCEGFGRSRYVADEAGNLHVYDSDGAKVAIHPAGRTLRILTRRNA